MPNFPIVDTHLHIWDHDLLDYSLLRGHPMFARSYQIEDYRRDCGDLEVEAMVFLECYADFAPEGGQYFDEIKFVEASAQRDPRIRGIVPMAPLEWGDRVEPMLDEMHRKHPLVKGIRRILEYEEDPQAFALSDDFIRGVNLLEKFDYHFSINANFSQMNIVREFVRRVPNVRMILDHCGKPGIRSGEIDQYKSDVNDLAKHPNLWIKLSDLPVEADHDTWTSEQLRPYIDATIEAFGFERTIYGGDWPICLQATSLERWVEVLDTAFSGVPDTDLRRFYRDNANSFYRLGL